MRVMKFVRGDMDQCRSRKHWHYWYIQVRAVKRSVSGRSSRMSDRIVVVAPDAGVGAAIVE